MEHAPNLLPPREKWKLVWSDEFDGDTLDSSQWNYRLHLLQKRHRAFTDRGAVLNGKGHLLLALQERDGHFYSPHLQTGSNNLNRPGEGFCFDSVGEPKRVWPVAKIETARFMHKF